MIVADNGSRFDPRTDQKIHEYRFELGLARLEVVAGNEHLLSFSQLYNTWYKRVLRRTVYERDLQILNWTNVHHVHSDIYQEESLSIGKHHLVYDVPKSGYSMKGINMTFCIQNFGIVRNCGQRCKHACIMPVKCSQNLMLGTPSQPWFSSFK